MTYSRIDLPTTPGRFISGIYFDPTNANHAWITYSGFSANTPAQPGRVQRRLQPGDVNRDVRVRRAQLLRRRESTTFDIQRKRTKEP